MLDIPVWAFIEWNPDVGLFNLSSTLVDVVVVNLDEQVSYEVELNGVRVRLLVVRLRCILLEGRSFKREIRTVKVMRRSRS
jgi:hypothetical protein